MTLPLSIDENTTLSLLKTSFNKLIEKVSQKPYENLLSNHELKQTVGYNYEISSEVALSHWYSEDATLNVTSAAPGGFGGVKLDSGYDFTRYISIAADFTTLCFSSAKRLYQDFTVRNIDINKNITCIIVYKLGKFTKTDEDYFFTEYVEKTYQTYPGQDISFDIFKTGTTVQPPMYTNLTGENVIQVDSKTFMAVKQFDLTSTDGRYKNLTFKMNALRTDVVSNTIVIPMISGIFAYSAEAIAPGMISNRNTIIEFLKYLNGSWRSTNDGFNFRSVINLQNVYIGTTTDRDFATLSEAFNDANNIATYGTGENPHILKKPRRYILTSDISEATLKVPDNCIIDGNGYKIYPNSSSTSGLIMKINNCTNYVKIMNLKLEKFSLAINNSNNFNIELIDIDKSALTSHNNDDNKKNAIRVANCNNGIIYVKTIACDVLESGYVKNKVFATPIYVLNSLNTDVIVDKMDYFGAINNSKMDVSAFTIESSDNTNIEFDKIYTSIYNATDDKLGVNAFKIIDSNNCTICGNQIEIVANTSGDELQT